MSTADAYITEQSLQTSLHSILDSCCRDLPDAVEPYVLSQLVAKHPGSAAKIEIPAEAVAWKKSSTMVTNKVQLATYLEDLRWGVVLAGLMERVLYERPKDAASFMISLCVHTPAIDPVL